MRYLLSCQKKRKEEIIDGIEKRYKTKIQNILKNLPMSDEKLYRMVLDVQNTAILQIKSCAKYSFSRDDVEKLEEDIRYRKSKFAGYIKDLQKNNDKKSKKLAVQDLHALFVEIEERL